MKIVSAYDMNNKLFEGTPYTSKKGETFIINEYGESLNIKDIKTYRIVEEMEGDEVQAKVDDDLNKLDAENNDKLKKAPDDDIQKAAEGREKELIAGGLDIKDGDYRDRFITSVKASSAAEDIENGTVSDSQALKNFIESDEQPAIENVSITDVDAVNTCTPEYDSNEYEDVSTIDDVEDNTALYKKIYDDIDMYTESTKKFNEHELLLRLCTKYKVDVDKIKKESLTESIRELIKNI